LGIKASRALELVSLHCALETKSVQGKSVSRDVAQGPSEEEVKPSKTIRFADQAKIINQ
jgi:hypothetical protein